jgi:hypothetical protein
MVWTARGATSFTAWSAFRAPSGRRRNCAQATSFASSTPIAGTVTLIKEFHVHSSNINGLRVARRQNTTAAAKSRHLTFQRRGKVSFNNYVLAYCALPQPPHVRC